MLLYIWEILVCFFESLLIIYLFYKKIGLKEKGKRRPIISVFIFTCAASVLTFAEVTVIERMALLFGIMVMIALWAYHCSGRWYKAVLWPSCYLIFVSVADIITFTIADLMIDISLEDTMAVSGGRFYFTIVYLCVIATIVWEIVRLSDWKSELPLVVNLILFILLGVGVFSAQSILEVSLVLATIQETQRYSTTLILFSYGILLMLFAVIIAFQSLGVMLKRNKNLELQRQVVQSEKQQYKMLASAAESLAEWKHDYQGQLRLISSLISEGKYSELRQFTQEMDSVLLKTERIFVSGNPTMDAVITLRIKDAQRYGIRFESKLFFPNKIPLSDVACASLLGNLLDNAIEACRKIQSSDSDICLEIKPFKQMLYIYCSNSSDGIYKEGKLGNLLTTKQTSGHGIGLRRMKEIVEHAGGTYQISPDANRFSVSIMFPLEGIENENSGDGKRSSSHQVFTGATSEVV